MRCRSRRTNRIKENNCSIKQVGFFRVAGSPQLPSQKVHRAYPEPGRPPLQICRGRRAWRHDGDAPRIRAAADADLGSVLLRRGVVEPSCSPLLRRRLLEGAGVAGRTARGCSASCELLLDWLSLPMDPAMEEKGISVEWSGLASCGGG